MLARWCCYTLLGCLALSVIHAEDEDYESGEIPDYKVDMSVDIQPKSMITPSIDLSTTSTAAVPPSADLTFSCFECKDCHTKTERNIQVCSSGIRSCYTVQKRLQNKNQVIRRGCSATASQCSVPGDEEVTVGSVTCCDRHQCNQAMFQQPSLLIVFIVTLGTLMTMMSNDI